MPPLTADVTVVVASQNRRAELLRSLPRHEAPTILVDNGSTDGTTAAVRAALPEVEVVELGRNHGAPARNIGVRRARTPYVAFADDDSWWAPGALARAVGVMDEHPRLAVLAARILVGVEERLEPVCVQMAEAPLGQPPDLPGPSVLGFIACGAVVRRDAFLSVGGFDPVVFFPGEEERVTLDLTASGWGLAYVDSVVAHHHPSPQRHGADRRERLITRNALLTGCMRRPWSEVARSAINAWRAGGAHRAGVVAALPRVPAALRRRRRLPAAVEEQLELLQAA